MGPLDIVIIVLALLAIVIGLWKGCAGLCFGFFGTIMCLVIAVIASFFLSPLVVFNGEGEVNSAFSAISQPISDTLTELDSDLMSLTIVDGATVSKDGVEMPLADAIANSEGMVGSALAMIGMTDLSFILTDGMVGLTIAQAISAFCTQLIVTLIFTVVLFIIFFIIKRLIRRKVFKWLDSNSTPSKVDRGIGVAVCLIGLLAIIWVVGFFGGGISETFEEMINQSPIAKALMIDGNLISLIIGK